MGQMTQWTVSKHWRK